MPTTDKLEMFPRSDLSAEAGTGYFRPFVAGFTGVYLFGAAPSQSGRNWIEGSATPNGSVQGAPVLGSGTIQMNGLDGAAQARFDCLLKQGSNNSIYASAKPVSPTFDPDDPPVIFSTNAGLAATNQNGDTTRTSTGITLLYLGAGVVRLYCNTYNPTTQVNDNIIVDLTGVDYTTFQHFLVRIGGGKVQLDDLTTGAHVEKPFQSGYAVDRNIMNIVWGDNNTPSTIRDGQVILSHAAIATTLHSNSDAAAMHAQFKERGLSASPQVLF